MAIMSLISKCTEKENITGLDDSDLHSLSRHFCEGRSVTNSDKKIVFTIFLQISTIMVI